MINEEKQLKIEEIIEVISDLILNTSIKKFNEKDGEKNV